LTWAYWRSPCPSSPSHDAVRVAEESLPIAYKIAESTSVMFPSAWVGLAYLKLGRTDDARQVLDRALVGPVPGGEVEGRRTEVPSTGPNVEAR
jgi:hypothetical protein